MMENRTGMRGAGFRCGGRLLLIVLALGLLGMPAFFAEDTYNAKQINPQANAGLAANAFGQNWFLHYKEITLVAAGIMVLAMALLYMGAGAMQHEELRQFARSELAQALASVLLVILIAGAISAADTLMSGGTNPAGGREGWHIVSPCPAGWTPRDGGMPPDAPMVNQFAYCYVDNLYRLAGKQGETILRDSVAFSRAAYRSSGLQTEVWFFLYIGYYNRPDANLRLDSEVRGIEFDLLAKFMYSLGAQRFFVGNVIPILGPAALLLGLILRTLFFTRRLGGLLLAVGLGLMIMMPAAYLLAWYTLQVAVYGPQASGAAGASTCPDACKVLPPAAYNASGGFDGKKLDAARTVGYSDLTRVLDRENARRQNENLPRVGTGNETALLKPALELQTCFPRYGDQKAEDGTRLKSALDVQREEAPGSPVPLDASDNCPAGCRYLPFNPQLCTNQSACDRIPLACKAIRADGNTRNDCETAGKPGACPASVCPDFCKLTNPQVRYESAGSSHVIPSENANTCATNTAGDGGDNSCEKCSGHLRSYVSETGGLGCTTDDCRAACEACARKRDKNVPDAPNFSPDGRPDCMTGIPRMISTDCNDDQLCGKPYRMNEVVSFLNVPVPRLDENGVQKKDANGNPVFANEYRPARGADQRLVFRITGVCPLECRVFFNQSAEAAWDDGPYKDPFWKSYCEDADMRRYCDAPRCPDACKVPVRDALGGPVDGKRHAFVQPDGQAGTCAEPPKYDADGRQTNGGGPCSRCPLSCRFSNPSSINDPSTPLGAFKSNVQYATSCRYYPAEPAGGTYGVEIGYSGAQAGPGDACPLNWYQKPVSETVWENRDGSKREARGTGLGGGAPACAPTRQIYRRAADENAACPAFIDSGNPAVTTPEKDAQGYYVALAPPNNDVSSECATGDALKFCNGKDAQGNNYCPASCKVDRQANGPYYCHLDNVADPYSKISDNAQLCGACASEEANNDHTKGPQCQVLLAYPGQAPVIPKGCAPACRPADAQGGLVVDPKAPGCSGFCYPRLPLPGPGDVAACETYTGSAKTAATAASCNACPLDCRFDFVIKKEGAAVSAMPDDARKKCGEFTSDAGCQPGQDCYYKGIYHARACDPACNGDVPNDRKAHCEDEGYTCSPMRAGSYWVNDAFQPAADSTDPAYACTLNVVAHDVDAKGCSLYFAQNDKISDTGCRQAAPQAWWEYACADSSTFALKNSYQPYRCVPGHKYKAVDELIWSATPALKNKYYECGELNHKAAGDAGAGPNPDLNFCGTWAGKDGSGNKVETGACQLDTAKPNACAAQYNARAVACLPAGGLVSPLGPAGKPDQLRADANCQQCPLFCRVDGMPEACATGDQWTGGGDPPKCAPGDPAQGRAAQCDLRRSATRPDLPGYCGVKKAAFGLRSDGGECALPQTGSGLGCPARCRLRMPDGNLPAGCEGGEIGDACRNGALDEACRGAPAANPCGGCATCTDDCKAKPYVRSSCEELCTPEDIGAGASALTPGDLTMSWEGAAGSQTIWRGLGALAIAAVVMPIFVFLITLAFIRSLSPLLGGDIEIPGLMKLI